MLENCTGFFRIPQVESFLDLASRQFSDKHITWLAATIAEDSEIQRTLPVLEKLGFELVRLYNVHEKSGKRVYTNMNPYASPPGSASLPSLPVNPHVTIRPVIQEFLRFIKVVAEFTEISAGSRTDLRPDEVHYQEKLIADEETFSCFRERNETYYRILASLKSEICQDEPLFLARWMMWRVYLWGLHTLQDAIGDKMSCARDVFEKQEELSKIGDAIVVSTYGRRFKPPMDLESMEMIWSHGVEVWSNWRHKLPIPFNEAHRAVRAKTSPIYSSGCLSQILLYGDLAKLGVIVSPTDTEFAALIVKANSGAMRGLDILGFEHHESAVAEALTFLRDTLNSCLPETVKRMFHMSKANIFDVEHALCKVARKQNVRATMSPIWQERATNENRRKEYKSEFRSLPYKGRKRRKLD